MILPILALYWRGKGVIGSVVRHASSSQWGHIGIGGFHIDGKLCYFDTLPGKGFGIREWDEPNHKGLFHGIQETGLFWNDPLLSYIEARLTGSKYSYLNGILAAFGKQPMEPKTRPYRLQCAQVAEWILTMAGLSIPSNFIPEPQGIANEIERITGHPVKRLFEKGEKE